MYAVSEAVYAWLQLLDANSNPVTGATVTAKYGVRGTAYTGWASATVTEHGGGLYYATFTPSTADVWTIQFDCANPNGTWAKSFPVGLGQEDDIEGSGFDTTTDSLVVLHDDHITLITSTRMTELDAANLPADIDSLKTICTEVRLSELGSTNIPADIDTLKTRCAEARLAELDSANIPADLDVVKADTPYIHDQAISTPTTGSLADYASRIGKVSPVTSTYAHPDGVTETTIFELTPSVTTKLINTFFDFTNLTQDATLKVYSKVDGTNYRELPDLRLTIGTTRRAGVVMKEIIVNTAFKFTLTSSIAEGASRNVPYRYFKEEY